MRLGSLVLGLRLACSVLDLVNLQRSGPRLIDGFGGVIIP